MNTSRLLAAIACALLSSGAVAALTLDRTTSLNDSLGGSLEIATNGSVEIPGANITSQATLTNFHPRDNQELTANGSITRTRERSDELATSAYNGSLTLTGTGKNGAAVNDTLTLQNVTVVRDGDGPVFSGTITLNGTSVDAAHMPDETRHLLHRVLRFFAFD